jgi:hypothetical protein
VDHHQVVGDQIEITQQLPHRSAAEIHVSLGLGQDHRHPIQGALAPVRFHGLLGQGDVMMVGQDVHYHETQIVRGGGIPGPGIPQADDEPGFA